MILSKFKPSQDTILIIIGGNVDKHYDKKILRRCLTIRPINRASIIPTASSIPSELADRYRNIFSDLEVKEISVIDIRRREEAEKKENFETINQTDLLFFTGGDQVQLFDVLGNTKLFELIMKRWKMGMIIAGTSAGAAAMSDPMIFDGDDKAYRKGTIHFQQGFGFTPGITFDTHFDVRERLPRLCQFLSSGMTNFGIGLSEDTGIVLINNDRFEVIGNSVVYTFRRLLETSSNMQMIAEGENWSCHNIAMSILREGDKYQISDHTVTFSKP